MDAEPFPMDASVTEEVHRVQRIVQALLRGGLVIAVVLMAVGLVMKVVSGSHHSGDVRLFSISDAESSADLLMALGVLALALTPAFRVVALIVLWARERDWRFVGVAVAVIATLGLAVLVGHG